MALGRGVQAVDRLGGDVQRGVEPEGDVGGAEVVVDRLGHADDVEPLGEQAAGRAQRVLAADRDQPVEPVALERLAHLIHAVGALEDVGAAAAQDRAAAGQDPARGLDRQLLVRRPRAGPASRRGSRSARRRRRPRPCAPRRGCTALRPGQSPPPVSIPIRTAGHRTQRLAAAGVTGACPTARAVGLPRWPHAPDVGRDLDPAPSPPPRPVGAHRRRCGAPATPPARDRARSRGLPAPARAPGRPAAADHLGRRHRALRRGLRPRRRRHGRPRPRLDRAAGLLGPGDRSPARRKGCAWWPTTCAATGAARPAAGGRLRARALRRGPRGGAGRGGCRRHARAGHRGRPLAGGDVDRRLGRAPRPAQRGRARPR